MKFLFDFFPLLLFFGAYRYADIYTATGVAIAATIVQLLWAKFRRGKVDGMLWVSAIIVVVFGGATLLLHDETFMKWKPTVLYWVFAAALVGARLTLGRNLIRQIMEAQIQLPTPVWDRLNLAWGGFFGVLGVLNLAVALNFPTETWVNFKVFGVTALILVFVVAQAFLLAKYVEEEKS